MARTWVMCPGRHEDGKSLDHEGCSQPQRRTVGGGAQEDMSSTMDLWTHSVTERD